jgi:hypothetical protein
LNLERSIDSLVKRFDKLYPAIGFSNKTGLRQWKNKPIIPLDDWIKFRDTPYALDYFPDDFDQSLTYIPEDELKERKCEDVRKWDSDYQELMEYTKNPNYGRLKCFHCLLSPDGDDPIFIGIHKLVAKGLNNGRLEKDMIHYPCQVINRFQCPYESTNMEEDDYTNSKINVDGLFRLHRMAFVVEIALAKARKSDSEVQLKHKQDLVHALTERDIFAKVLKQVADTLKSTEYLREISGGKDIDTFVDYFMEIKDKINVEELRFY